MKIKILGLTIFLLTISGCSIVEETIDAGKNVASAVVDESVDLGQTAISIPVYPNLTLSNQLKIIKLIKFFFKKYDK